jgi:hypothetical protein
MGVTFGWLISLGNKTGLPFRVVYAESGTQVSEYIVYIVGESDLDNEATFGWLISLGNKTGLPFRVVYAESGTQVSEYIEYILGKSDLNNGG